MARLAGFSGDVALVDTLRRWGVTLFAGVNGGGIIHVLKHLEPFSHLDQAGDGIPRLLTLSEYVAGFVPLGYFMASGRIAACISTTGAATKLAMSGLSEAKYHNIPALYAVALNPTSSVGLAPLQDVSASGMNLLGQLMAELGTSCVVLDDRRALGGGLARAHTHLAESRPVALALYPDVLAQSGAVEAPTHPPVARPPVSPRDLEQFFSTFPAMARGRRVVIFVGEEATRYEEMRELTTALAELLRAPTVWSVNGANAVSPTNRYGFGHILFGGNDRALAVWAGLGSDDLVIALGFDPGEYTLNLATLPVGGLWHFTGLRAPYGQVGGGFAHRVAGAYHQVRGDMAATLKAALAGLRHLDLARPPVILPESLNDARRAGEVVRPGAVDLVDFYQQLARCWRAPSIGFDDVCVSYRDRQYVCQRPHPAIRFYAPQEGSPMGAALGLAVGAKVADPRLHTFAFTGDGCWRLFGGALAEAATLDLRVFVLNNEGYGIVRQGLRTILPEVDETRYHARLAPIDFVAAARAHGWHGHRLKPDLRNLPEIMEACYTTRGCSILVEVPVDPDQIIGPNPRLLNLTEDSYL